MGNGIVVGTELPTLSRLPSATLPGIGNLSKSNQIQVNPTKKTSA